MKNTFVRHETQCILVGVYRRFGGTCCLHIQSGRIMECDSYALKIVNESSTVFLSLTRWLGFFTWTQKIPSKILILRTY
jgi:hypothetical protein